MPADGSGALILDGTLAETEVLPPGAFNAAAGVGWRRSREDDRRRPATTGGQERTRRLMAEEGLDPAPALVARRHAGKTRVHGGPVAAGPPLCPALIEEAEAAAANALCRAGFGRPMAEVCDALAAGDMVRAKEPAPDATRLALPGVALAFGDLRNGVPAAGGAGVRVVLSQGPFTPGEPTEGAALVLGGLAGPARRLGATGEARVA